MIVTLSAQEKKLCRRVGAARNAAKDPSWTRRKSDVFTDRQVDILGCVGEVAATRVFGGEFDQRVHTHGDDGHDLITPFGPMAVKFNHRHRGYLMIEERPDPWSDLKSEFIALVHGHCRIGGGQRECFCAEEMNSPRPSNYEVAGWLFAEEFKELSERKDWGLGGRFICRVDQLRRAEDFEWFCEYAGYVRP